MRLLRSNKNQVEELEQMVRRGDPSIKAMLQDWISRQGRDIEEADQAVESWLTALQRYKQVIIEKMSDAATKSPALVDYHIQIVLLEAQNFKRLLMIQGLDPNRLLLFNTAGTGTISTVPGQPKTSLNQNKTIRYLNQQSDHDGSSDGLHANTHTEAVG
jgi:hypothetical protein